PAAARQPPRDARPPALHRRPRRLRRDGRPPARRRAQAGLRARVRLCDTTWQPSSVIGTSTTSDAGAKPLADAEMVSSPATS
ncbi:MAG: hypothetical protein ACK559_21705, partial [bacterium]